MTPPGAAAPPATRLRLAALAGAVVAVALVAAAAVWLWMAEPRVAPLEPGWTATTQVIGGDGVAAWRDGDASRARFSDPFGVAVGADGTVYVADAGDAQRVRAISPGGQVFSIAGGRAGFADGVGPDARFDTPSAVAVGADGTLYVADTGNNAIRRVTPDGRVSTLAGTGEAGYADGAGNRARFNGPVGVAVDDRGRVLVADTYNDRIRAIAPGGTVSTLAGAGVPGADDGPAETARFDTPSGVAVDEAGNVYVADTGNGLVRTIGAGGAVTTSGPLPDGLVRPIGIAAGADGHLYLSDDRGRIVHVSPDGAARTLAGAWPGYRDGAAARFRRPAGVAVAGPGRLIVADAGNALVRTVAAPARLAARLPASPRIAPRFDDEAFGRVPLLWPVSPMDGPHEVAGTLGEARGGEGSERFHAGIDVRGDDGARVHAVRDGVVTAPVATGDFGSVNEWLRIGAVTYVHLRAGRTRAGGLLDHARFVPTYDETGRLVRIRVKRGARFATGETVGSVNAFHHVHLNVGWPGEEHNPLRFRLTQFEDTIRPTIARGGVRLFDEAWQPIAGRRRGRVVVSGRVQIVVDAWDQAEGNRPGRRLGLYALGYQVLHRDGTPAAGFERPLDTLVFDRLSPDPDAARLVFAPGSGIPYYGRRVTRFLYTVTNRLRHGRAAADVWDTTRLAPGDYVVRITARDFHGNAAIENRELAVTIE